MFDCIGSDDEWKEQQEVGAGYVGWFHQVLIKYAEPTISILSYRTILLRHFSPALSCPYYSF